MDNVVGVSYEPSVVIQIPSEKPASEQMVNISGETEISKGEKGRTKGKNSIFSFPVNWTRRKNSEVYPKLSRSPKLKPKSGFPASKSVPASTENSIKSSISEMEDHTKSQEIGMRPSMCDQPLDCKNGLDHLVYPNSALKVETPGRGEAYTLKNVESPSSDISSDTMLPKAFMVPDSYEASPGASSRAFDGVCFVRSLSVDEALQPEDSELKAAVEEAQSRHDFSFLLSILQNNENLEKMRGAAAAIRGLTRRKDDEENRASLANSASLSLLLSVLTSSLDPEIIEDLVCVTLNISVLEEAKIFIMAQEAAPETLIRLLDWEQNPWVAENAAATIHSLATTDERRELITDKGAIPPLLKLLKVENLRARKDAAAALHSLSKSDICRMEVLREGGMAAFLELMQKQDVEEKALVLVTSLLKNPEGVQAFLSCSGAFGSLCEMLYHEEEWCRKEAVGALLELVNERPETLEQLSKESILPVLHKMSHSKSTREMQRARRLLVLMRGQTSSAVISEKALSSESSLTENPNKLIQPIVSL